MVFLRVAQGVKEHFPIRVSEWVMVVPAVGMWLALQLQPDMFSNSPSFKVLAAWGSEGFWGFLCLMCAATRLVALTVNGTFKEFPYSPHMRMGASLIGCTFWGGYSLAFVNSAIDNHGSLSAVVAYSTFVLFELMNFYRSRVDLSAKRQG